jgi:hypothetical protein
LILNFLNVSIQLARTSRRQPYSSLVAPLKEARRGSSEEGKKSKPPPGTNSGQE